MSPQVVLLIYIGAVGLILGSYLNVVIYRLPRRLSTVFPRSRCPRCRTPIKAYDNIPVLSYLILRGRCRSCGLRIPWKYPVIEALNGAMFVAVYLRFGVSWEGVIAEGFCSLMLVLAMIDLEHYILPDVLTLPGIAIGLLLQPLIPQVSWVEAAIGVLLGGGLLYAVAWGWYLVKGICGMGMGDVKMLAMIGAFLGWKGVVITLFLSSLVGSIVGAVLMLSGQMRLQSKLPFGFFLGFAAVGTLLYGPALVSRYLGVAAELLG